MDRRVRKSQQAIKEALITLINKDGLDNITVSDLCKEADINRSTFYLHFKNMDELIEAIEEELANHITHSISHLKTNDLISNPEVLNDLFVFLLSSIQEESELILAFMDRRVAASTRVTIEQVIENIILERMEEVAYGKPIQKLNPVSPTYIAVLFSSLFTSICTEWLVNGLQESPEVLAKFINEKAYQPIIQNFVQELEQFK